MLNNRLLGSIGGWGKSGRREALISAASADFPGVNNPTKVDFRLPV